MPNRPVEESHIRCEARSDFGQCDLEAGHEGPHYAERDGWYDRWTLDTASQRIRAQAAEARVEELERALYRIGNGLLPKWDVQVYERFARDVLEGRRVDG